MREEVKKFLSYDRRDLRELQNYLRFRIGPYWQSLYRELNESGQSDLVSRLKGSGNQYNVLDEVSLSGRAGEVKRLILIAREFYYRVVPDNYNSLKLSNVESRATGEGIKPVVNSAITRKNEEIEDLLVYEGYFSDFGDQKVSQEVNRVKNLAKKHREAISNLIHLYRSEIVLKGYSAEEKSRGRTTEVHARVWIQHEERNKYSEEELEEKLESLLDFSAKKVQGGIFVQYGDVRFPEISRKIEEDELRPADAEIDQFYGYVRYERQTSIWEYRYRHFPVVGWSEKWKQKRKGASSSRSEIWK